MNVDSYHKPIEWKLDIGQDFIDGYDSLWVDLKIRGFSRLSQLLSAVDAVDELLKLAYRRGGTNENHSEINSGTRTSQIILIVFVYLENVISNAEMKQEN